VTDPELPDDRRRPDDLRPADAEPVLPSQTRDDTDAGWGEPAYGDEERRRDERLRADRPPHWD
jgi:hypothetical protein